MFKGACHIHSTYSDGDFTLAELREVYTRLGCSFALVTDHAEYFDDNRIALYQDECARLSDGDFLFVPGLEYGCENRMHILGYGSTRITTSENAQEVFRFIEAQGGVSGIAHPRDAAFAEIESLDVLPHGIEVWNTKYDGRYAPRPRTFALLNRLQKRAPNLRAFYGQDQHWREQYRGLLIQAMCTERTREALLDALRSGSFYAVKDELELPSSGIVAPTLLADFEAAHKRSSYMRDTFRLAKRAADGIGLQVPPRIKAQLRRIF